MERYYEAIDLLKGMISRPSFSRDDTNYYAIYIRVNIHINTKYNIFLIFRKCITKSNCRWLH